MTVNTLGTDSRLDDSRPGGDALAAGSTRRSWTESRWPLLAICIALFSISALVYYHLHRTGLEPTKLLPRLFAGIYDVAGLAPSLIFFLMVAAWGAIWLHNGKLDRPVSRLGRLLMMAALLGVTLNLGDVGGVVQPHKGAFGAWLAQRLVDSIGYVPTLVLVWPATFASLVLATEFFFHDYFEGLRRREHTEVGVEAAVTDHLRGLSAVAPAAPLRPAVVSAPQPPVTLRAATPSAVVDLTSAGIEDEALAEALAGALADDEANYEANDEANDEASGETEAGEEHGAERMSYAERRAARQARRAALMDIDDAPEVAPEVAPELDPVELPVEPGAEVAALDAGEESEQPVAVDGEQAVEFEQASIDAEAAAIPDEGLSDAEVFAIMASIDEQAAEQPSAEVADEEADLGGVDLDTAKLEAAELEAAELEAAPLAEPEPVDSESAVAPQASPLLDGFIRLDGDALSPAEPDGITADEASGLFADEASQPVESIEPSPLEDVDEVSEPWTDESEPSVAIPRPEAVSPTLPTPPAVKQQQLFGGADEVLVQEAMELVVESRRVTAALLQRKLRVDYELACELLRELASRGVVALEGDASRARVIDA